MGHAGSRIGADDANLQSLKRLVVWLDAQNNVCVTQDQASRMRAVDQPLVVNHVIFVDA
ncbi:hypothetical protein D3C74_496210 [compost metagenome]